MHSSTRCLALALLIIATHSGCGGGDATPSPGGATDETGVEAGGSADATAPADEGGLDADGVDVRVDASDADGKASPDPGEGPDGDTPPDDDASADDGGDDADRPPPDLGPCMGSCCEDRDCPPGQSCVLSPISGERSCVAIPCARDGSCPKGTACGDIASPTGDITRLCRPPLRLCRPCREHADCADAPWTPTRCLDLGDDGSFCGAACTATADCPTGFECFTLQTPTGLVGQCRPEAGGHCPCEDAHLGFETDCRRTNEFGTCAGMRTCDTPCTAPFPAAELCDGIDNDCDGETDEALTEPCSNQCGEGQRACVDGAWSDCDAPAPNQCFDFADCRAFLSCVACQEAPEERCNGVDDDCDGETDEGVTRPCQAGCGDGVQTCSDGQFGDCVGPEPNTCTNYRTCTTGPVCGPCPSVPPEQCNGVDDDCDGETDEELVRTCFACGPGEEVCVAGEWSACNAPLPHSCTDWSTCGTIEGECDPCPPPPLETCNGVDDDCDGQTDEDLQRACSSECGLGNETCTLGEWGGCDAPVPNECIFYSDGCRSGRKCGPCADPPPESCNDRDDDCDGQTDEALSRPCSTFCGQGTQGCEFGSWTACDAEQPVPCRNYDHCGMEQTCGGCPATPPDICNGADDDCDGGIDNADAATLCGDPPAPVCEGDLLRVHDPVGTCAEQRCRYTSRLQACPFGCGDGACLACAPDCSGGCGDDGCGGSCGRCPQGSPLNRLHNTTLSVLARWFVPAISDGDHRTVNSPDSRFDGGTFAGQTFYIPLRAVDGTAELYSLKGPDGDSMDSLVRGEGGYGFEKVLGWAWTEAQTGTCPLGRRYAPANDDHATVACGEEGDFAVRGYAPDGTLGHGYPRFGTACDVPLVLLDHVLEVVVNRAAGGAVSELRWAGDDYLNRRDYGRLMQTSFNLASEAGADNPRMAGDVYGCPGNATEGWAHGSPLLSAEVEGSHRVVTETRPLQWQPEAVHGSRHEPVAYQGTITRDLRLNVDGFLGVARWDTSVELPGGANFADVSIVGAHALSDLSRVLVIDAQTGERTDITGSVGGGRCLDGGADSRLALDAGAIVAATGDGARALMIYRSGPRQDFRACRYDQAGDSGPFADDATAIGVGVRRTHGLPPGRHAYTAFVAAGTLDGVTDLATRLFRAGH